MFSTVLVLLSLIIHLVKTCPLRCSCNNGIVDCKQRSIGDVSLDSVLNSLPNNTRTLLLTNNHITKIQSNKIFKDITKLDLSHNYLTTISHVIQIFPSLQSLKVNYNKIKVLEGSRFKYVTNLVELCLNGNMIEEIKEVFNELPRLTTLQLAYNQIKSINDKAFNGLTSLTYLDVSHNLIQVLPHYLFNFNHSKLLQIDLQDNNINEIPDNLFQNGRQYGVLMLSNNKIKTIGNKAFQNVTFSNGVYLDNNTIETIPPTSIINFSTNALRLADNSILCDCDLHSTFKTILANSPAFESLTGACALPYQVYGTSLVHVISTWENICSKCQLNNICHENGACYPTNATSFNCKCSEKYEGKFCEKEKICHSESCQNKGTCKITNHRAVCLCTDEFKGNRCEIPNLCFVSPCKNNGVCNHLNNITLNDYTCQCTSHYTGKNCDTYSNYFKTMIIVAVFVSLLVLSCFTLLYAFILSPWQPFTRSSRGFKRIDMVVST